MAKVWDLTTLWKLCRAVLESTVQSPLLLPEIQLHLKCRRPKRSRGILRSVKCQYNPDLVTLLSASCYQCQCQTGWVLLQFADGGKSPTRWPHGCISLWGHTQYYLYNMTKQVLEHFPSVANWLAFISFEFAFVFFLASHSIFKP